MLLSLVYFVKVIHQREVIENFAENVQCSGTIFVTLKQWGCALQIKVARDQASSPTNVSLYLPFDKPFASRPSKFIISAD